MCDCINKFNEQLREHNVAVESQSIVTFGDDGRERARTQRVKLATYKVEQSRQPKLGVFPEFCPFCGERYLAEPDAT